MEPLIWTDDAGSTDPLEEGEVSVRVAVEGALFKGKSVTLFSGVLGEEKLAGPVDLLSAKNERPIERAAQSPLAIDSEAVPDRSVERETLGFIDAAK